MLTNRGNFSVLEEKQIAYCHAEDINGRRVLRIRFTDCSSHAMVDEDIIRANNTKRISRDNGIYINVAWMNYAVSTNRRWKW